MLTDEGEYVFVDNYNQEYSRDLEPMEGGHGDQYYQWMIKYISAYKAGNRCPVLVEDDYLDQVDAFVEQFKENSLIMDTLDLTAHGACPGTLIVMKSAGSGKIREIYDYAITCKVNPEDPSTMTQYVDDNGIGHVLQKVSCPDCGLDLEMDMWEDAQKHAHQIIKISKGDTLILEIIE